MASKKNEPRPLDGFERFMRAALNPAAETDGKEAPPSDRRLRIALEASWELEAAADVLLREIEESGDVDMLNLRPMAARSRRLAGLIMSALGDDQETEEHMTQVLHGRA